MELSSDGASDIEAVDDDLAVEEKAREVEKKLGMPEVPHDALPSALAQKFM